MAVPAIHQTTPPAYVQHIEQPVSNTHLSFKDFKTQNQLAGASTEKFHPLTMDLSQTMNQDIIAGLEQLWECDQKVLEGYDAFSSYLPSLTVDLKQALDSGGRVIFLGSGSSGRLCNNVVKQCQNAFPEYQDQIIGQISGGLSAMIRAKEGFEDSATDGEIAIAKLQVTKKDIVFVVSASGHAPFNVGAGHAAANQNAKVYYLYNSNSVPPHTQALFKRENNKVIGLPIDIGPQAIGGSTRLQAATLDYAALGIMLENALTPTDSSLHNYVRKGIEQGNAAIKANLPALKEIIEEQHRTRSAPESDTHFVEDTTNKGYITYLADDRSFPETCLDTTELPPTFNEPFYRKEGVKNEKRPSIQAYMLGNKTNAQAWSDVAGAMVSKEDQEETSQYLISAAAEGQNSYANRPKGEGNMLIGVLKLKRGESIPEEMLKELEKNNEEKGSTAMIVICDETLTNEQKQKINAVSKHSVILENIPLDPLGLCQSIALKQTLNLISNAAMILDGYVLGNRMINVRAANYKLIDRCMRLCQNLWAEQHPHQTLDEEQLYYLLLKNRDKMQECIKKGVQPPPVIAITLKMLELQKTSEEFDEVVQILNEERKKG